MGIIVSHGKTMKSMQEGGYHYLEYCYCTVSIKTKQRAKSYESMLEPIKQVNVSLGWLCSADFGIEE